MGTLHEDIRTFIISCSVLVTMRNHPYKFVEKIKIHILCWTTSFQKSWCLWDNVEKCSRTIQDASERVAHAHCMLYT